MTLLQLPRPLSVPFSHAADYSTVPQKRPQIEVEIAAVSADGLLLGRPIRTELLVDSGADVTVLDNAYASALGVDLSRCKPIKVTGVTGSDEMRETRVKIGLCGQWLTVPVWFGKGQQLGLLGRKGVFDNLLVAFAHGQGIFLATTA